MSQASNGILLDRVDLVQGAAAAPTILARDGLGSVRAEVASTGTVTRSARYAAYGAVAAASGTSASPLGLAGEIADPSGLIYLRARWYRCGTRRRRPYWVGMTWRCTWRRRRRAARLSKQAPLGRWQSGNSIRPTDR